MKKENILYHIAGHGSLIFFGALFFVPFYWMVMTSLKSDSEIFTAQVRWLPQMFKWQNYSKAIRYIPFLRYLANTLMICVSNVIGAALSCSLVA